MPEVAVLKSRVDGGVPRPSFLFCTRKYVYIHKYTVANFLVGLSPCCIEVVGLFFLYTRQ